MKERERVYERKREIEWETNKQNKGVCSEYLWCMQIFFEKLKPEYTLENAFLEINNLKILAHKL